MTQNVSETLNKAADLIEKRGWVGTNGQGWEAHGGDPLCLEGAIKAAADIYGIAETNTCPAGRAVRDYLDLGEYAGIRTALFMWNDEVRYVDGELVNERTAEQVIETLRAAALVAAAREVDVTVATRPAGSSATWSPPTPLAVVPVEVGA